jgi:hypothetical protein
MVTIDELRAALEWVARQEGRAGDLQLFRQALARGEITAATGERAVAIGGDASDLAIITGNGNVVNVFKGMDAYALKGVLSEFIHNHPERRRRIVLIRWLKLIADQMDAYINELWRLGFGKDSLSDDEMVVRRAELHWMHEEKYMEVLSFYTRVIEEVPDVFPQTTPSQWARDAFSEVFPAFKRESEACFEGVRTLESALDEGFYAPLTNGTKTRVPFSLLFFGN